MYGQFNQKSSNAKLSKLYDTLYELKEKIKVDLLQTEVKESCKCFSSDWSLFQSKTNFGFNTLIGFWLVQSVSFETGPVITFCFIF